MTEAQRLVNSLSHIGLPSNRKGKKWSEESVARFRKHGHAPRNGKKSKTYTTWRGMRNRCTNPKAPAYKNYGGRGITVCTEWRFFKNFLRDMGESPKELSLDRVDNSKGYSKENCRWATKTEQAQNTRKNTLLTLNGKTQCLVEWSRVLGIHRTAITRRLARGFSDEQALAKGIQRKKR